MNPTEQWSNDDTSLRAKGGYITRIAQVPDHSNLCIITLH